MTTRSKVAALVASTTNSPLSFVDIEPPSHKEALLAPIEHQAMIEEPHALHKQHTWTFVPLPFGKTTIGYKWVFKVKRNSDGTIARHKARLVAKGYLQQEGIDYQKTLSLVAKLPTIRILLCLALHHN